MASSDMILCDTNILIGFYKNNPAIIQELKLIGSARLAISVITQTEVYYGAIDKGELQSIKRHLSLLKVYPITTSVSNLFLALMENYALSHRLNIPDALIAATALTHNLDLYTLNTKDFRYIPHLKLHAL